MIRTAFIATTMCLPVLMIGCVVKWDLLVPLFGLLA